MNKQQRILNKLNSLEGFTSIHEEVRNSDLTAEMFADRFLKRIHEDVLEIIKEVESNNEEECASAVMHSWGYLCGAVTTDDEDNSFNGKLYRCKNCEAEKIENENGTVKIYMPEKEKEVLEIIKEVESE